jgi:hypothetical protein
VKSENTEDERHFVLKNTLEENGNENRIRKNGLFINEIILVLYVWLVSW